jgi:hypothetical protein
MRGARIYHGHPLISSHTAAQIKFALVYRLIDETMIKPPKGSLFCKAPKLDKKYSSAWSVTVQDQSKPRTVDLIDIMPVRSKAFDLAITQPAVSITIGTGLILWKRSLTPWLIDTKHF